MIVLIVASGCDLVFLDRPAPPGTDAPITEPSVVTGRHVRRTVVNDATYLPIALDVPLTDTAWTVVLDDGTRPEVTMEPDGRFSFERRSAAQGYRLSAGGTEYQLAASQLELVGRYWGRVDRDLAPPGTTLTYEVSNVTPEVGSAFVQTTGLWTQTKSPGLATPFTIEWDKAGSLWAGRGLLRTDRYDRAYYTLHDYVNPYHAIVGYRIDDVTLASSQDTHVEGPISFPPRDLCIRIAGAQKTEMDRLIGAGHGDLADFVAYWAVYAVPRLDVGPDVGLSIAYATLGGASIANTLEDVHALNPFNGHALVVGTTVYVQRSVTGPGAASSALLTHESVHWAPATEGCAAPSTVGGRVAVPLAPSLDSRALMTDDTAISIDRSALVPLTWSLTSGAVDRYRIRLLEIGVGTMGETTFAVRGGWVTVSPGVAIDPALLETDRTYVFSVTAELGFPGAAVGDFGTIGYPHGHVTIHTPTFRIDD